MKTTFYLFLVIAFTSCASQKFIYSPASANLLQLDTAKDIKVALNYATAGSLSIGSGKQTNNGLDVQTAYAINDRIAIKLDGFSKWESNASSNTFNNITTVDRITYKKKELALSAGFYKLRNATSSHFQLFLGIANGSNKLQERVSGGVVTNNYHNTNYWKLFFQPSFSVRINKNYTSTIATRFSMVKYYNTQTDYPNLSKEALGYIETKPSFFADFIFQNEFGFSSLPAVRFQVQIGLTQLFTSFYDDKITENRVGIYNRYYYNNAWFMLGTIVDMKKIF
jgi:hypothetical protein